MNTLHDITPLLAEAGWHHDGFSSFPFGLLWLAVLGVLIWLVVRTVRTRRGSASEILAERYARGEVSSEEYRERLAELRRNR